MNLALSTSFFPFHPTGRPWRMQRPAELRIDVDPRAAAADDAALDALHQRLHAPGDRLHGLPAFPLHDPGLRLHVREADGEFYAYVEDLRRGCLAGSTVFNRLVEVGRRADRHLRAPHSRYRPAYQRRGIAGAVYRWALDAGICLMTGARQSPGAHALWHSLARAHESGFAEVRRKQLRYLGSDIAAQDLERLETRMFLLGRGWTLESFRQATQMD
ncbi:N-acetyltransferase [Variovorax boronicumulans]|uniref:N-acetyltransferase n=1 Tax=Variovorax boronicumulans TaxID=436515 RepID=UPI00214CD434